MRLIPREAKFFSMFAEMSANLIEGARLLRAILGDFQNVEVRVQQLKGIEHRGDEITHAVLTKLNQTFITPFDREDIHHLVKNMDDVIDEIDAAAKRFTLYQITDPTIWLSRQTDVLVKSTRLVGEAVRRLRDLRKQNGLHGKLVEIHELENEGDENNHAAIAELFSNATDPLLVMKLKEIYELTERAIDRCEDIADTIEAIVLKNT